MDVVLLWLLHRTCMRNFCWQKFHDILMSLPVLPNFNITCNCIHVHELMLLRIQLSYMNTFVPRVYSLKCSEDHVLVDYSNRTHTMDETLLVTFGIC